MDDTHTCWQVASGCANRGGTDVAVQAARSQRPSTASIPQKLPSPSGKEDRPYLSRCSPTAPRRPVSSCRTWASVSVASLTLSAAVAIAGCGASTPSRSAAPSASQVQSRLPGLPAPLAALHAQANHLLAGGAAGLPRPARRAARLSGGGQQVGVVVRALPERVPGLSEGRRRARPPGRLHRHRCATTAPGKPGRRSCVASRSPTRATPTRSRRSPAPSAPSTYFPQTLFFSRGDHRSYVFDHAGPYESAAALTRDIERYLLR